MITMVFVAWFLAAAAPAGSMTVNAVVSDASCGATHLKDQNSDCVVKCLRGGASVGHPEWLPQRMVLVERRSGHVFIVANPASLVGHEGKHVRVRTTRPDGDDTVRVLEVLKQE